MDNIFYSEQIYDDYIILPEDEANHAIKVLRKKCGDEINVVDGLGCLYQTSIELEDVKNCRLNILSVNKDYDKKEYYIHIAISPTKSHDRLEMFIEKAVEIGVDEISFILTSRSERNNVKLNRLNKLIINAMKQSLKASKPIINDMVSISNFLNICNNRQRYIAHLNEKKNDYLINIAPKKDNYCILIGPEGDFSYEELAEALDYRFKSVGLGRNRLRTETAAIAACHILNLVNDING